MAHWVGALLFGHSSSARIFPSYVFSLLVFLSKSSRIYSIHFRCMLQHAYQITVLLVVVGTKRGKQNLLIYLHKRIDLCRIRCVHIDCCFLVDSTMPLFLFLSLEPGLFRPLFFILVSRSVILKGLLVVGLLWLLAPFVVWYAPGPAFCVPAIPWASIPQHLPIVRFVRKTRVCEDSL